MERPNPDEKDLVLLLKAGDKQAFEMLYWCYGGRLTGYLIKMTKSEYSASEILQETFMKVWMKRDSIDASQSFRSYLFKIATNLVYDYLRKSVRDTKIRKMLIEKSSNIFFNEMEENLTSEEINLLNDVINMLPPKRKQIFELVKIEERSYFEVSSLLNISVSTINDHVVRANKFLREKLLEYKMTGFFLFVIAFFI